MGQGVISYKVYILPQASQEIDRLPGHVRQRVRRAVIGLRDDPKPALGIQLDLGAGRELWRLRLDTWHLVYLLDRDWGTIYVLAVRKRPPYQYEDLASLVADAG
jgi:mRNA-degrading endonuclease RelE of RelBE toxin-antitoxin system